MKYIIILISALLPFAASAQTPAPISEFIGIKDLKKGLTEADFKKLYPKAKEIKFDTSCKKLHREDMYNLHGNICVKKYELYTIRINEIEFKSCRFTFYEDKIVRFEFDSNEFIELFKAKYGKGETTSSETPGSCRGLPDNWISTYWLNSNEGIMLLDRTLSGRNSSCEKFIKSFMSINYVDLEIINGFTTCHKEALQEAKKRCNASKLGDF